MMTPRNVRNFWIKTSIDGRKTEMSGGPVSKSGGFYQEIFIRNEGTVVKVIIIEGYVDKEKDEIVIKIDLGPDKQPKIRRNR